MKALLYMSKRKWINKLKQLKKKPVNLILSIVLAAYFIFLITVSVTALVKADFQTPYWLLAALTVWGLYNFFINFGICTCCNSWISSSALENRVTVYSSCRG